MPTSTRRKRPFYGGLPAKPRSFSILRRRGGRPCPPAGNARFYGNPMRIRNILKGGQSRPPLQMTVKNRTGHAKTAASPVCTIDFHTSNIGRHHGVSGARNRPVLQTPGAFVKYILRCRDRCPHRPAGNGRFMAAFRRNRVHFLFYAVGADDPVRPQETPVFTEIRCESATFSMGRCRHRPLHPTTKIQRILRADRVVRPYK